MLTHDDDQKGLMEIGACVASTFEKMKWNAQGLRVTTSKRIGGKACLNED